MVLARRHGKRASNAAAATTDSRSERNANGITRTRRSSRNGIPIGIAQPDKLATTLAITNGFAITGAADCNARKRTE